MFFKVLRRITTYGCKIDKQNRLYYTVCINRCKLWGCYD